MSLPFLQPEKMASVIAARRVKKDGSQSTEPAQGEHPPELMAAAEDLIRQVQNKSASGVATALKNAFMVCDSYDEGSEGSEE